MVRPDSKFGEMPGTVHSDVISSSSQLRTSEVPLESKMQGKKIKSKIQKGTVQLEKEGDRPVIQFMASSYVD